MNLHPGVSIALRRLSMTETDVAKAMRDGLLTSPHQFENITLFDMRITGTGAAYRQALNEFVWRDPSIYLNQDFVERCSGLAVILEHPPGKALDTKEYRERTVGAIMLPYIKGDEVWGIAKIHDADAARVMERNQLSTSPAVVFKPSEASDKRDLGDGATLLIEGRPSLLDHLAICEAGVWDKGGEPTGIITNNLEGDRAMTGEERLAAEANAKKDAEEKARKDAEDERARKDAEAGEKLDKLLTGLDSMSKRMDALEAEDDEEDEEDEEADPPPEDETVADRKARRDKARRDRARRDEEEREAGEKERMDAEEKERADTARKDSEATANRLAALERRMPAILSDADRSAMADAQVRADSVYALHGKQATRPMDGEDLVGYQRRLATEMKSFSKVWKDVDLGALPPAALGIAVNQIYTDADEAGRRPSTGMLSGLREIKRPDSTGRNIYEFVGDPREVWNPRDQPRQFFKGTTPQSRA